MTDGQGEAAIPVALDAGVYRVMLQTQDRFGEPVTAQRTIHVVDPEAGHLDVPIANHLAAPRWSLEPGELFTALWGTGYASGQAFVEVECRGQVLRAWWTDPGRTQEVVTEMVTEDMRGGFTLRVTYVRENRAYVNERIVDVPWTNKQLTLRWETFRSLLAPGQEELWAVEITGPDALGAVAEMVAGAYDASLDQFLEHHWLESFSGFRRESSRLYTRFENKAVRFQALLRGWRIDHIDASFSYRHFPYAIRYPIFNDSYWDAPFAESTPGGYDDSSRAAPAPGVQTGPESSLDLEQVSARQNLEETAFFYPHLLSDEAGVVRMEFTMPEALTEWRFFGFAHDAGLRSGFLTDTAVTAKDLMVQP
ncbi:MAG: alpha-2-macroglobulin family protein, partial [Planctomycetota bacterium]